MTGTGNPLIDTGAIAGAISFFVPLIVSVVTKKQASDAVKGIAGCLGAAVAAVIALWLKPDHEPITWELVVTTVIFALITQISAYTALWQHGAAPAIADATANFGVGKPVVQGEVITDGHNKEIIR